MDKIEGLSYIKDYEKRIDQTLQRNVQQVREETNHGKRVARFLLHHSWRNDGGEQGCFCSTQKPLKTSGQIIKNQLN
jgi:hypothetical protein